MAIARLNKDRLNRFAREERAQIWADLGMAPPKPKTAECGTDAKYAQHRRAGRVECIPCKKAHNEYIQEYRARIKARAA